MLVGFPTKPFNGNFLWVVSARLAIIKMLHSLCMFVSMKMSFEFKASTK